MLKKSKLNSQYIATGNAMRLFTGSPNKWNNQTQRVEHIPTCYQLGLLLCGGLGMFHSFHIVLELVKVQDSSESSNSDPSQKQKGGLNDRVVFGTIFVILNYLTLHCSYTMLKEGKLVEGFINGLLQLEDDHVKGHSLNMFLVGFSDKWKVRQVKSIAIFIRVMAQRLSPFLIGLAAVKHQKQLMNILLYPPGNYLIQIWSYLPNEKVAEIGAKFTTFAVSSWVYMVIMKVDAVLIIQVAIGTVGLSQMIKLQLNEMRQSSLRNLINTYRRIQLLASVFNKIHSKVIVLLFITVLTSQIMSTLKLIHAVRGNDNSTVGVRLYYVRVLVTSIIVINTVYGFCGDVSFFSEKFVKHMRHCARVTPGRKCSKMFWKMIISLPIIKIEFGPSNFIEKLTPIMFQQFATLRVIDAMLVIYQ
ncbi:unnamed protein product [Orchesella dallaii]|uniref:Odorant receptor n=1 Tax=Orchesella dallaii TaxID=48710 RepID=A0ABP1S7R0_9HEXA